MRILAADHKNDTGSRERERERERGRREGTERGDRARERQSQVENERWCGAGLKVKKKIVLEV